MFVKALRPLGFGLACIIATLVLAPDASAEPKTFKIRTDSGKSVHVRNGPGVEHKIVGSRKSGDEVTIRCYLRDSAGDVWDKISPAQEFVKDQYVMTGTDDPVVPECGSDRTPPSIPPTSVPPPPVAPTSVPPPPPVAPTTVPQPPAPTTVPPPPPVETTVQVPDVYLDGPTGRDGDAYESNCLLHTIGRNCAIPSSEKLGTDGRGLFGKTFIVGTMYHAVWGVGLLIEQQQVGFLGRYCNWSIDFEYFDSSSTPYRYDAGPLHQRCDLSAGRSITHYYGSGEPVNHPGRGRYFKAGYVCAYLVTNNTRRITSCTDLLP